MSVADVQANSVLAPTSTLLVKRVSDRGTLPTRGSPLAAGYDLYRSWLAPCSLYEIYS